MIRARRRSFAKNNLLKQGLRHEGKKSTRRHREITEKQAGNYRKISDKLPKNQTN
jgi:hypothetical protein